MIDYKFSIITVSLNSEKFLDRCIQSVKNQNYKNFEHIIIDGCSADKTVEIINKNKSHFSQILIEKDNGIWDAMNKGIQIAKG